MSNYALHELLGEGGMGAVYAGEEVSPSGQARPIACKIMSREFRDNDVLMELFRTEAETNRRISDGHDGLVKFYHWFSDQEQREFLIMELVSGVNLEQLGSASERLSFDVIRLLARDVLDALAYVHEQKVIHRDISPGNVLVSCEGSVKLLDFGLAKAPSFSLDDDRKERSVFRGKRAYVSPEVVVGEGADERSDLYSFASMLFELLTGEPPFGDVSFNQLYAIANEWSVPELPDNIPEDLRTLTLGLLRRHPHEREPATAAEARDTLVLDDEESARASLASLAEAVFEHRKATRAKALKRGSFAGVWIRGMHITHGARSQQGRRPRTFREGRRRAMLRFGVMSVIGVAATVALVLAVYLMQRDNGERIAPAPAAMSDSNEPAAPTPESSATRSDSTTVAAATTAEAREEQAPPLQQPRTADEVAEPVADPQEARKADRTSPRNTPSPERIKAGSAVGDVGGSKRRSRHPLGQYAKRAN